MERIVFAERDKTIAALGFVLLLALALRLVNIGFGLPSLYDPDEPMFMLKALKLLKEGTLNPGWFGHPGSTTIYLLAVIQALVLLLGLASGRFVRVEDFATAAYADPGLLFLPSRLAMVLFGVACVYLTWVIGRRLFGTATGLLAALLLALNPLHIAWSQVIRTDVQATVFMLGCIYFAIRAWEEGRIRDYCLAGVLVGLATATKWPAGSVAIAIIGAAVGRGLAGGHWRREVVRTGIALTCSLAALVLASPYLVLDWQTALANVSGEVKPSHLGSTGMGFFANLRWYLSGQVGGSMGWIGLALALGGLAVAARARPAVRWVLLPPTLLFVALISSQGMIWSRWILPMLPLFCLYAAVATIGLARFLGRRFGKRARGLVHAAILLAAIAPSLAGAIAQTTERANDTRDRAARWAVENIPAGKAVVLEHLALGLRDQPWHILFPLGEAGCADAVNLLETEIGYEQIRQLRNGSPIVDLGNVPPQKLETCRADFAILTYFDLYEREAARFPREARNYERLLAGGRTVALFRPEPGRSGGPVVRIVALRR